MQFEITDEAAINFASEFYSSVAIGDPIDAALAAARLKLYALQDDGVEWATPVLHMRAPDGRIFDVAETRPVIEKQTEGRNRLVVLAVAGAAILGAALLIVEFGFPRKSMQEVRVSSTDSSTDDRAQATSDSKVEIGNFHHSENGCHSSSRTVRFPIQNADKLDRTRPGTIQGVTVEPYAANGGVIADARFESPDVFLVTGTATGGGHWVASPIGGGGVCVGATGADIGAHIYGFFH